MKRNFTSLFLMLALLTAGSISLKAQTNVPALITSNQVWDITGSPYNLTQNTYIDQGVSVKIMPGVEVLTPNGLVTFIVDGELQALGTVDSMIYFDSLQIELTDKSVPYDSATGAGAYFNFCEFSTPGIGKRAIYIRGNSTKIENCIFYDIYYGIYVISSNQPGRKVEILNNQFIDNTGTSFPIYTSGSTTDYLVQGNTFTNNALGGGMYLNGRKLEVKENSFAGQNRVSLTCRGNSSIHCNTFINHRSGVEMRNWINDSTSTCDFTHNTLDSCGMAGFSNALFQIYSIYQISVPNSHYNYNNFLTYLGNYAKVYLSMGNSTPSSFGTVDLQNNYWASTDSATIESYIRDYGDDIKLYGRADFTGALSSMSTTCTTPPSSSCEASYYFAVDNTNPNNIFLVNNSTGVTNATDFVWFFGDGGRSFDRKPTYTYILPGTYSIKLILSNQAEGCYSQYEDQITYDSNGFQLKNGSFTISVLNESDLSSIGANDFGSVKVYPNPSKGQLFIDLEENAEGAISLEMIDLAGKTAYSTNLEGQAGNRHVLDISELENGIYLLRLHQGQRLYTTKIVVSR